MTSQTPNGSDDSMAINHYMLRVEFYGYERTAMESNIQNAIEKIQRMDVTYRAPPYRMLPSHNLLEFTMTEETNIAAFEHFTLQISLIQQTTPSCLFFIANLLDAPKMFPNSSYVNGIYHKNTPYTLFRLDTDNGYLKTPPPKIRKLENEYVISTFQLSILMENLSFSIHPFDQFNPVESKNGKLFFPLVISPMGQTSQTQMYQSLNQKFTYPPPPVHPPRLFRGQDPNESIHWDPTTQSYISNLNSATTAQQEFIKEIKKRRAATVTFAAPQNSPQTNLIQPQPLAASPHIQRPAMAALTPSSTGMQNLMSVNTSSAGNIIHHNFSQSNALAQIQAFSAQTNPVSTVAPQLPPLTLTTAATPNVVTGAQALPTTIKQETSNQTASVPQPTEKVSHDHKNNDLHVEPGSISREEMERMRNLQISEDALSNDFEWDSFIMKLPDQQFHPNPSYDPVYPNIPNTPGLPYGPPLPPSQNTERQTNPFQLDFTSDPPTQDESHPTNNLDTVPDQQSTVTTPKQPSKSPSHVTRSTTGNSKPKQTPSDFVPTVLKKMSKVKKRGNSS